jgi:hypothetical protein
MSLPATGWERDFQQVSAVLHLPPGWKLFAMGGVDTVPDTWLSRWTLMDLFLVLIVAISFFKLWHWRMGLLSILLMALIWHEPNAPRYVWLNILAAIALIRVLPKGRFKSMTLYYRNIALITLVLIALPFMVNQIRNGLFPQLEKPWQPITRGAGQLVPDEEPMSFRENAEKPMRTAMDSLKKGRLSEVSTFETKEDQMTRQSAMLNLIDPNTRVQTGPGIPQWNWRSIPFNWNGPVKSSQRMKLFLLSPKINMVLNFLRVTLLLMLAFFLFKTSLGRKTSDPKKATLTAALVAIMGMTLLVPQAMGGDFPGPELLNDLKNKLLAPPDCFPECAQISRMALSADKENLTLRIEIHAGSSVALPLPGTAEQWLPVQVILDGKDAGGLYRSKGGGLWLQVDAGIHQVVMTGPLPMRKNVQLPLPLKPRLVTVKTKGWTVKGVRENATADDHLQLERIREKADNLPAFSSEPATLPTFVKIERILHLGLDWTVENRMTREAPHHAAIVIEVPLLPGESVTTPGFRVKDGKVLVSMAPGQRSITWQSVLEKQSPLTLTAPKTTSWTEIWKADAAAIWHTRYSGLTVIHHQDPSGHWLPEWRPWPGESITLHTQKPKGVKGQTLTIDNSRMEIKPGRRATDTRLVFSLNSSQGGQHTIKLPDGADLQSVLINNAAQPLRQKGQEVTLPVKPGKQTYTLSLRCCHTN